MNIFLNIGTNLGNRRMNLSRAVRAIEKEFGYFELSHVVESAPWGYESANPYLNIGMLIHSDLEPLEVLRKLQAIESTISPAPHRSPDGTYVDRVIDIDIIAIDDRVISTTELNVPHPSMHERRFVLEPMAELAPLWVHPKLGLTPHQLLQQIPEDDK